MLRTAALWGTFVLASRELHRGQSLEVGDGSTALIAKPDESPVSGLPIRAVGNGWELDARGATGGTLHLRGRIEDPCELGKSGAPVPIDVTGKVVQIVAAGDNTCALTEPGRVYCWTFDDQAPPAAPPLLLIAFGSFLVAAGLTLVLAARSV